MIKCPTLWSPQTRSQYKCNHIILDDHSILLNKCLIQIPDSFASLNKAVLQEGRASRRLSSSFSFPSQCSARFYPPSHVLHVRAMCRYMPRACELSLTETAGREAKILQEGGNWPENGKGWKNMDWEILKRRKCPSKKSGNFTTFAFSDKISHSVMTWYTEAINSSVFNCVHL